MGPRPGAKRRDAVASTMRQPVDSPEKPAVADPAAPAWARLPKPPQSLATAAFCAGAALARLDAAVRAEPAYAGVWRRRLTLNAAAATLARAGRSESEITLRDALHLTQPGDDPGPAGRALVAWRALTDRSIASWRSAAVRAAKALNMPVDDALEAALDAAQTCLDNSSAAPFAAARSHHLVREALGLAGTRRADEGEMLAAWLADAVLAQKLQWPFALPLLAASLSAPGGRAATRRDAVEEPADGAKARIVSAYARAAGQACDLAADLARRAQNLLDFAPQLRAKGAGAAVQALLDEDALGAATRIPKLSERGARRLFERLVYFDVARELTGRSVFRLYGL